MAWKLFLATLGRLKSFCSGPGGLQERPLDALGLERLPSIVRKRSWSPPGNDFGVMLGGLWGDFQCFVVFYLTVFCCCVFNKFSALRCVLFFPFLFAARGKRADAESTIKTNTFRDYTLYTLAPALPQ